MPSKILLLSITIVLLAIPASPQMMHFDSILHCASSVKRLVGNCLHIAENRDHPQEVVRTAATALKLMPKLLDDCGKQTKARLLSSLLSRECISLVELEASFTIKAMQLAA
jgi:hypothetical protein